MPHCRKSGEILNDDISAARVLGPQHSGMDPTWHGGPKMVTCTVLCAEHSDVGPGPSNVYIQDPTTQDLTMIAMLGPRRHVGPWSPCSALVAMLSPGRHVESWSLCWVYVAMLGPRCHVGPTSPCWGPRAHVGSHTPLGGSEADAAQWSRPAGSTASHSRSPV